MQIATLPAGITQVNIPSFGTPPIVMGLRLPGVFEKASVKQVLSSAFSLVHTEPGRNMAVTVLTRYMQ